MHSLKLIIAMTVPALVAASCNTNPDLPPADAGYSWKTTDVYSALTDHARSGYIGAPTWSNDTSKPNAVTGVEQYFQQKNICSGFPVCESNDSKDYRYRAYIQTLGSSDVVYITDVIKGINTNVFHLATQNYWLITHQTEAVNSQLVINRITQNGNSLKELGRESVDFVGIHDSWWIPSPDGTVIGRAVCNRMPNFANGSPAYTSVQDKLTGNSVPFGHCALGFIDPTTGNPKGKSVTVKFPWANTPWDMNNEPYSFSDLTRFGFAYWKADGSFAVSDYSTAAFALVPGDSAANSVSLRPCKGPLTLSAAINLKGEILTANKSKISIEAKLPESSFKRCN